MLNEALAETMFVAEPQEPAKVDCLADCTILLFPLDTACHTATTVPLSPTDTAGLSAFAGEITLTKLQILVGSPRALVFVAASINPPLTQTATAWPVPFTPRT